MLKSVGQIIREDIAPRLYATDKNRVERAKIDYAKRIIELGMDVREKFMYKCGHVTDEHIQQAQSELYAGHVTGGRGRA